MFKFTSPFTRSTPVVVSTPILSSLAMAQILEARCLTAREAAWAEVEAIRIALTASIRKAQVASTNYSEAEQLAYDLMYEDQCQDEADAHYSAMVN